MSALTSANHLIRRTYDEWHADDVPHIAAALTYYVLLSVAPLLVLLVGALGRLLDQATVTERIYAQAYSLTGPTGEQLARELISNASPTPLSFAASAVALLIAFLGAMQVFRQLRIAFDRMWSIPAEKAPPGGLWVQIRWSLSALGKTNLAAFLIVLAAGGLFVASLVLSSVIGVAAEWIAPVFEIGATTLRVIETALSLVLVTVLFAVVYRFLPRTSIGWKDVWVGAIITSALFMLGRLLLGVYFTFASPGSAYGAAGSVVAFLVWVNVSLQLALFGAEFTHVWAYAHGTRATAEAPDKR